MVEMGDQVDKVDKVEVGEILQSISTILRLFRNFRYFPPGVMEEMEVGVDGGARGALAKSQPGNQKVRPIPIIVPMVPEGAMGISDHADNQEAMDALFLFLS